MKFTPLIPSVQQRSSLPHSCTEPSLYTATLILFLTVVLATCEGPDYLSGL